MWHLNELSNASTLLSFLFLSQTQAKVRFDLVLKKSVGYENLKCYYGHGSVIVLMNVLEYYHF